MDEQAIKLLLQLTDSGSIEEAIGKFMRLKGAIMDTRDTYALAEQKGDQFVVTTRDVSHAMDRQVEAAVEATMRQRALNQVLSEGAVAGGKFNNFMSEHKFRILEAGRAVQDFAQGGVAGILNNIERLVGGSGVLAGVLTAVGVAAYVAWPYIKKWGEEMGAAGEKFAVPLKGTEALTEAIKKNKKEMEDLREKTNLTYLEMLKYVELASKTAKMEEDIARAKEARAILPGASKAERDRAAAVREAIAEGPGTSEMMIERIMDTQAGQQLGMKRVEEIIVGAQKGFPNEVKALQRISPQFAQAFEQVSPERKQQIDQAKEMFKKEGEILDKRNKEREHGDEAWKKAEAELAKERNKEEAKGGREDFDRFKRRMAQAKQERLAGERGEKQDARQDEKEAMFNLQRQAQQLQRGYEDEMSFARAMNANADVIANINIRRRMFARNIEDQMMRLRETVMGGQNH